jgi:hypothetical protein
MAAESIIGPWNYAYYIPFLLQNAARAIFFAYLEDFRHRLRLPRARRHASPARQGSIASVS